MKNTEIAFILDRSGSMESMTNAAIAGFNEFLKAQQATHARHAATFAADADDLHASHEVFARKISASRKASMMCSLNELESATLKESMAETLDKTRKEKK